jgi:hypothetical protein
VTEKTKPAVSRALAVGATLCLLLGCRPASLDGGPPRPCETLDSLFARCGLGEPLAVSGQATVDVQQVRMRGKIDLDARGPDELAFEFTSTILFGHEREDFVFSVSGDTLRIIDRERGAYYEGADAEDFLADSFEADFDLPQMLSLALGGYPPCGELSDVSFAVGRSGETVCSGRRFGRPFRAVFGRERGLLSEVEWPVRSDRHEEDRLSVEYQWGAGGDRPTLDGLILALEVREWRCKIKASRPG